MSKDYLGNNRAVINGISSAFISQNAPRKTRFAIPYRAVIADLSTNPTKQPYKFGGKELITANGLNEYDFGARNYYPAVPTFTRIDPMAEKYPWLSPYLYCANNPPHPRPRRVESPQPICRPSFSIQSFRYRLASSIPFKKKPHSENDSACDNYQVFQRVQSPSFAVFIFFN